MLIFCDNESGSISISAIRLCAPFAQLFSLFKPGANEATGSEIIHTRSFNGDPRNLTGTAV